MKIYKKLAILFLFTLIFSGCEKEKKDVSKKEITRQQEQEVFQEEKDLFEVLRIIDGDTFSIKVNDKTEVVRVLGIDAPELSDKYSEKERCFGEQAKDRAAYLLEGGEVSLEKDETQDDRDKYNRLLRYVYLGDGTFLNQVMIEEGFAREYTFKNLQYKHRDSFLEIQKGSAEMKRGLWGFCVNE